MSSFLPVGQRQEQELNAVRTKLLVNDQLSWTSVDDQPIREYQTQFLSTMAFSKYFISRW